MLNKEIPTTFQEYQTVYPEIARIIVSFSAYRTIANLDHNRFWDPDIYQKFMTELQTDNPILHPCSKLYDEQLKRESVQHRAASDAALPANLERSIKTNTKALELWENAEPEEFEKSRELIDAIMNNQLNQFDRTRFKEILNSSLYIFPGLALAMLIRKDRLQLEDPGTS